MKLQQSLIMFYHKGVENIFGKGCCLSDFLRFMSYNFLKNQCGIDTICKLESKYESDERLENDLLFHDHNNNLFLYI